VLSGVAGQLLDSASHQALPQSQNVLVSVLVGKKRDFFGETTVMKFIGG
jgi:hypothetical protein